MDVVHAQGLAVPTLCLWSLRVSPAPVNVGTFHTYFEGGHWGYKYLFAYVRSTMQRTDRLIAVSDPCITAVRPYFPDSDFEVIPNGVDTDLYRPLDVGEARPPGPPRILFVGRFDPRNGLDTMLEAARILQDEGRDFVLQVVGDGPMRQVYHRQARSLGVWDRVEWLGLLDKERPRLYREATVFAAPCVLASFGVVLLEAMASGTPIVCADNVGFRQVIRDGAPGHFVPPSDSEALAAGIGRVLDDEGLRREWRERGRRVAVDRYSWPEIARRVEGVYLEILASKDGRPETRPPLGVRYNLRRNPIELVRNVPAALRAGYPKEGRRTLGVRIAARGRARSTIERALAERAATKGVRWMTTDAGEPRVDPELAPRVPARRRPRGAVRRGLLRDPPVERPPAGRPVPPGGRLHPPLRAVGPGAGRRAAPPASSWSPSTGAPSATGWRSRSTPRRSPSGTGTASTRTSSTRRDFFDLVHLPRHHPAPGRAVPVHEAGLQGPRPGPCRPRRLGRGAHQPQRPTSPPTSSASRTRSR